MPFSRRRLLTRAGGGFAIGLLAPGLLAACGGPQAPTPSSPPPTGGGVAKPVNFWFTVKGGDAYAATYQQLADQFNKSQSDYAVTVKPVTVSSNSSVIEQVTTAIASNTQPDAIAASAYLPWQFYSQGHAASLDDVVGHLQSSNKAADFDPGVLDVLKYQGHYVGLPTGYDILMPYYRKDIFAKYGIAEPKTWDDLMSVGAALQKQGVYLFAQGSGQTGWQQMMCLIFNNGGGLYDEKGNVNAANPRNVETLTFLSDLVKKKYISPSTAGLSDDDITRMFATDQAAIMYYHPGFPAQLSQLGANVQLLSPYAGPHGDKGTLYWVNNGLVFGKAPNPAGGKAWLEWLVLNNGPLFWQGLARQAPTRKSDATNPYFANDVARKIVQEWIPAGKTMATHDTELFPQLATLESSTVLPNLLNAILQGEDPTQALQTAQAAIQNIMQA